MRKTRDTRKEREEYVNGYVCEECGAKAYAKKSHVRVNHYPLCARWVGIQVKYPVLVRMIQRERKMAGIGA